MSEDTALVADAQVETTAALRAGAAIGKPKVPDAPFAIPYAVIPDDHTLVSLEHQIPHAPPRRRALVSLYDGVSFAAYVNAFKCPDTLAFADLEKRTVVAVLDYHEQGPDGDARWGQHRATLVIRLTPEWTKWTAMDRKKVTQIAFAEFIEDNLPDIAVPEGSRILEVSRSLEATKTIGFASGVRLDNGETQLTYTEQIEGAARVNQRKVSIPEKFILGLAPFEGAKKYIVEARLRYRIGDGGALSIGFDLVQPDKVLEDAFSETVATVTAAIGVPVLRGAAPADLSK